VLELSRSQALVYGAIAVALLLLGARWVRGADDDASGEEPAIAPAHGASATGGSGAGEGVFSLEGGGGDVVVHVAGAVRDPGVYRLPEGSRVTDAVERAGGVTADGSADAINLAAQLADGQQVVVPAKAPVGDVSGPVAGGATAAEGPISLGTATVDQLETIEGIGPVTAGEIIEFRDRNGGLSSIEELDEISGIGPATMDALREGLQP
jgi:competence protein ComEA